MGPEPGLDWAGFNSGLTEDACSRPRSLNARWGLGNNYVLVVPLENLDRFSERLDEAFSGFIREYGAPDAGKS